jgi:hypothetical protein
MTVEDIPEILQNKFVRIRKARPCAKCGVGCLTGTSMRYVVLLRRDKQMIFYHCAKCAGEIEMGRMLVTKQKASKVWKMPYTMRRSES